MFLTLEYWTDRLFRNVGIATLRCELSQKSADLKMSVFFREVLVFVEVNDEIECRTSCNEREICIAEKEMKKRTYCKIDSLQTTVLFAFLITGMS